MSYNTLHSKSSLNKTNSISVTGTTNTTKVHWSTKVKWTWSPQNSWSLHVDKEPTPPTHSTHTIAGTTTTTTHTITSHTRGRHQRRQRYLRLVIGTSHMRALDTCRHIKTYTRTYLHAHKHKRRHSSRNAGTVKEGTGAHAYKLEPETKRYEYAIQESRTTRRTHPPAHFSRYAGMSDTSGTCGTWTRWMQVVPPKWRQPHLSRHVYNWQNM